MSDIKIEPNTWVKVLNADVSGSFRLVGFEARVKRSEVIPTGITGVTIPKGEQADANAIDANRLYWKPKVGNTLNLYVYNMSRTYGLIEVDV